MPLTPQSACVHTAIALAMPLKYNKFWQKYKSHTKLWNNDPLSQMSLCLHQLKIMVTLFLYSEELEKEQNNSRHTDPPSPHCPSVLLCSLTAGNSQEKKMMELSTTTIVRTSSYQRNTQASLNRRTQWHTATRIKQQSRNAIPVIELQTGLPV